MTENEKIILSSVVLSGFFSAFISGIFAVYNNLKTERLKADLSRQNNKSSHVFVKTEEVITTCFRHLQIITFHINELIEILTSSDDDLKKATWYKLHEKTVEYTKYYNMNFIYLPENTVKKMGNFYYTLQELALHHQRYDRLRQAAKISGIVDPNAEKLALDIAKKIELLRTSLGNVGDDMMQDFRNVFGFSQPVKTTLYQRLKPYWEKIKKNMCGDAIE